MQPHFETMAKSSRASSKKANNQRKAAKIFGPAESARAERLSARLLELAKQPKPESTEMKIDAEEEEDAADKDNDAQPEDNDNCVLQRCPNFNRSPSQLTFSCKAMDVDSAKPSRARGDRKRVDKRRQKKAGIVFKKYSDRVGSKKKNGGK
ncbi:hypothetical protein HJFPF1_11760 [Paramyrothecium foliicola]|nr:hypothetical protein HJFPF1_11760 [Paramyrothecium foliicola]